MSDITSFPQPARWEGGTEQGRGFVGPAESSAKNGSSSSEKKRFKVSLLCAICAVVDLVGSRLKLGKMSYVRILKVIVIFPSRTTDFLQKQRKTSLKISYLVESTKKSVNLTKYLSNSTNVL